MGQNTEQESSRNAKIIIIIIIIIIISSTVVIPKSLSQSLTRLNLPPNTYIHTHNCKNL